MTPVAVLDLARAMGAEITVVGGKLAARGLPPDLRADVLQHKDALLELLQRPAEPSAAERRLIVVVEDYAGWWPLAVPTLCRALVAESHPLASTPTREFVAGLDAVTPKQKEIVRRIVEGALAAGLISDRAVDLR